MIREICRQDYSMEKPDYRLRNKICGNADNENNNERGVL